MDDQLLYNPKLQPEREYYSDAVFEEIKKTQEEIPVEQETPLTPLEEIKQKIEAIQSVAVALPAQIYNIIEDTINRVYDQVVNHLEETLPVDITTPGVEVDVYRPQDEPPVDTDIPAEFLIETPNLPADLVIPQLFPDISQVPVNVIVPKTLGEQIKDVYNIDMCDIHKAFILEMQRATQSYLQEMLTVQQECGASKLADLNHPFDANYVKLKDANQQHLADSITRSQIVRDQKQRLFKKTHNIDQTIAHLRAAGAAYQMRKRYYEEKYGDGDTYLGTHNNRLLLESRSQYDEKYKSAAYNLYKYLHSSVIVINDILNMQLKEAQAKGSLIKSGVDVLATAPVGKTTEVASSTDATGKTDITDAVQASISGKSTDSTKTDATKTDATKTDATKTDSTQTNNTKTDTTKTDATKTDSTQSNSDSTKTESAEKTSAEDAAKTALAELDDYLLKKQQSFYDEVIAKKDELLRKCQLVIEMYYYVATEKTPTLLTPLLTVEEARALNKYKQWVTVWGNDARSAEKYIAKVDALQRDIPVEPLKFGSVANNQTLIDLLYDNERKMLEITLGYYDTCKPYGVLIFQSFE